MRFVEAQHAAPVWFAPFAVKYLFPLGSAFVHFVFFVVNIPYSYMRRRLSALSSRINFFCFGDISTRSRMPLTVLGNVESKCG